MSPKILGIFVFLAVTFTTCQALPPQLKRRIDFTDSVVSLENGAACNDVGEIQSEDPCRPWCICKDGVVVCAEIFCTSEIGETCGKIKVEGRCCPTFVCVHSNGTASMHYPLPLTVVPPVMYEMDSKEKPKKRPYYRVRNAKQLI